MTTFIKDYIFGPLFAGCAGMLAKPVCMAAMLVVGWLALRPQSVPLWPFQRPGRVDAPRDLEAAWGSDDATNGKDAKRDPSWYLVVKPEARATVGTIPPRVVRMT
ncbi:hypothetical protein SMACR_04692 [Sordaria macrospora]|uniref:Uncharacterized protein n=1 Tax=Sordaria macrospora TaxID=5147 RepID=A0A8S8ZVH6_SORMA|nr:hypothetical protein SMACR_04692 [Sordaria macrospora]KAH7630923.1 hypothetical protein B0T09DRAFT_398547 [Sordaria sp. MPI-SDFR-AT-0083]WPJ61963.1 hypothetical protein SMAC4_04692 [Sordaria macrospora]